MLSNLPTEILLRIISYIPLIRDKCHLMQTGRHLKYILCHHPICWSNMDMSSYPYITNHDFISFIKCRNIPFITSISTSLSSVSNMISALDLSGCHSLSDDMLIALAKSFTGLTVLRLNGYCLSSNALDISPQERKNRIAHFMDQPFPFENQRDHVYQVPPSYFSSIRTSNKHGRLVVPFIVVCSMVDHIPGLSTISIQYQEVTEPTTGSYEEKLASMRLLDISSCEMEQSTLQTILRTYGRQLTSLKMLNIELTSLSMISLLLFGKGLECLHLSCKEPTLLPNIALIVSKMKNLKDFRLNGMRSGDVDFIIENLNIHTLQRLDISPKMNIYPRSSPIHPTGQPISNKITNHSHNNNKNNHYYDHKHPTRLSKHYTRDYTTLEHDLHLTDRSLFRLSHCRHLTELRLCYPLISPDSLHSFFLVNPQLEQFELRCQSNTQFDQKDYLIGIHHLTRLKELQLFSVTITPNALLSISTHLLSLKHLTVNRGGYYVESAEGLNQLLSIPPQLNTLLIGQLSNPIPPLSPALVYTNRDVTDDNYVTFIRLSKQSRWHIL
ncbi:hypothetical protein BDB01DRAFT_780384 [Pilobolus umbonatus]|nr:hypothetical protein BDB01DRAFT_780384 [Pilobolus umbonatus]